MENRGLSPAFTIVEFAIVLLIVALVFGTITPVYFHIIEKKRIDYAMDEITKFQRDIDRFSRKNNRYPDALTEIYAIAPVDPWGAPYKYLNIKNSPAGSVNPRTNNNLARINADYDLYSEGPDTMSLSPIAASESRDDIIRGRNGNFVGTAADYK